MVVIQAFILTVLLIRFGAGSIKKHPWIWRSVAFSLSCFTVAGVWSGWFNMLPAWTKYVLPLLSQGALAGMLFIAVMYAAAVKNGSRYMKMVMPVRGELSILASILTLGHNTAYGRTYFVRLFTGSPMAVTTLLAAYGSLIMIAIMVPLFITSFPSIRRKMKPKKWKQLQRLAYIFYAVMYAHIMLLNVGHARLGSVTARINVVVYSLLFITYFVLRTRKALEKARKPAAAHLMPAVGILSAFMVFLPAFYVPVRTVADTAWADGTYTGKGVGYNGLISVNLTISGGKITDLKLKSSVDDEPYLTTAKKILPIIVEAQSTDVSVDAVSGATTSTQGILKAVEDALNKAGESSDASSE